MEDPLLNIAVLGASGLIGQTIATDLMRAGWSVVPVARRFTVAQKNAFAGLAVECPITSLDAHALALFLAERRVDIVVNCIGMLQDSGLERADNVHRLFVARLIEALGAGHKTLLLVHLSIPGTEIEDGTKFSRTKREAERLIATATVPFVILRPGFVIAMTAYGGSALIRALAALPLCLPTRESNRPFTATDIADIAQTVAFIAKRWRSGEQHWAVVWDVMQRQPSTVGSVIDAFRQRFGGQKAMGRLPAWFIDIGARAGDLSAYLGWRPPIRSTALRELRRGVKGDPEAWIAATGIEPAPLEEVMARLPATVQEKWFARLYLVKAVIIGSLVAFWSASGLIALTMAFHAATEILTTHGIPQGLARGVTKTADAEIQVSEVRAAARALQQRIEVMNASSELEIDTAFVTLAQRKIGALLVGADPFFNNRRDLIISLAARRAIPAIYPLRDFTDAGGLMSYGTSLMDAYRQVGIYAARILKGEKPGELPVVQPTKFDFVINLKTAKALRLQIPDKMLALADEVIE